MKPRQGPQLYKACNVEGGGRNRGYAPGLGNTTPGSQSAGGNKRNDKVSVSTLEKSPPTSLHDDMYINHPSAHLMTLARSWAPYVSAYSLQEKKAITHPVVLVLQLLFLVLCCPNINLTSVIMKKSSPGSPCTTIFSPSSN